MTTPMPRDPAEKYRRLAFQLESALAAALRDPDIPLRDLAVISLALARAYVSWGHASGESAITTAKALRQPEVRRVVELTLLIAEKYPNAYRAVKGAYDELSAEKPPPG